VAYEAKVLRLFLKTLEGPRLRVWSDISMVPLGTEEIDIPTDALGYIVKNTVTTEVRQSITINGAHVIRADIMADNGIMHVIDKVLVPAFTAI
jgi:fasciclin domain-containing protein